MTKQKDLKRRIRALAAARNESYIEARRAVMVGCSCEVDSQGNYLAHAFCPYVPHHVQAEEPAGRGCAGPDTGWGDEDEGPIGPGCGW